jgi:hypothetical protein
MEADQLAAAQAERDVKAAADAAALSEQARQNLSLAKVSPMYVASRRNSQSIDSGFAITHHGHIEGQQTIIISTCRGQRDFYIIK